MTVFPERRAPGARGRIGIIQPAPGVMLEHEWPGWLPPGILFPVGRLHMPNATADGYARMAKAAPDMARDLATAGVGVIAYACTVGSLFAGIEAEKDMIGAIKAACGKPAISLGATSMAALRAVGARRIAIMTPYTAETNHWVADYAIAQGMAVEGFIATPVDIMTVGDMSPAEVAALAIAQMTQHREADALWIPCTAIQTMAAVATIEAATGRPVISGTQALLWHALAMLGITDPISGAGRLFDIRGA